MITHSHSITNKTLITVSGVCGIIVIAATFLVYAITLHGETSRALQDVGSYGALLAERENNRFGRLKLVQTKAVEQFNAALLTQDLNSPLSAENDKLFEFLFPLKQDGTRRSRPGLYEGLTLPSGQYVDGIVAFVRDGKMLSNARKRRILTAFFVILRQGREIGAPLNNFFYASVYTDLLVYMPGKPDRMLFYQQYAPPTLDVTTRTHFQGVMPVNNPEGRSVCTPMYDRPGAAPPMKNSAGCYSPIYGKDGEFSAAFGTEIYFSDLYGDAYSHAVKRFDVALLDSTGTTIIPPQFALNDGYDMQFKSMLTYNLPVFEWIYDALELSSGEFATRKLLAMDPSGRYHVGSQHIQWPQWYMVVFSKHSELVSTAQKRAVWFLTSSIVGLIIICLIVAMALRIRVGGPLEALIVETRALARNVNSNTLDLPKRQLPTNRSDEIGVLARSFDAMAQNVLDAQRHLKERIEQRTSELMAQKVTAEHANQAKTRFVASMSHELRTPLNAITGFAEMLRDDAADDLSCDAEDHLKHLLMSADHLSNLVNDVLDFARLDVGVMSVSCQQVDLSDCIAKAQQLTDRHARSVGVDVSYDPRGASQHYVFADALRVVQVIVNLLSNAIKYGSRPGHVRLTVREVDGGYLRVDVCDNGPGIPADQVERVFQPFERLDEASISGQQGAGIGLSLCTKLLSLMNGHIGVHLAPGGGSVFWIDLPKYQPAQQSQPVLDAAL